MDINALLSPDSSSAREGTASSSSSGSNSSRVARRPAGGKRTASGLSQEVSRSPDRVTSSTSSRPSSGDGETTSLRHAFPMHSISEVAPGFRPLQQQQAVTSAPSSAVNSPGGYGERPVVVHRHLSTPQMETLADLALMQQRQHTNTSAGVQHSDIFNAQRSLTSMHSSKPPPVHRNLSGQSLADLTMAEGPAQTPPPRSFTSNALSETESQTVNELLGYLNDNSYAYDSHVALINLLHKGFLAHAYPSVDATDAADTNPRSYGLLAEMRQAREAMDTRFAVGEDLWIDWLADESLLASSGEERVTVTELFQKAVQDEPASVRLWQAYADWVQANYTACNDEVDADENGWTAEDKEMVRELFTKNMLSTVVEQGVAATQWRFDESHVLWNRYTELLQQDLPTTLTSADVERLRDQFMQRLQIPHATLAETKQTLWPIINKQEPQNWEAIMDQVNEMTEPVARQVGLREEHELALQRTIDAGDRDAMYNAFSTYLQWERKHKDRGPFGRDLCSGLYERALLAFPTHTEWWLDYIDFMISNNSSASVLPLIERATRHCPWSGDLWAKRILRSDVEGKSHAEIEQTKHRATNSGLLDVGGMEELLKVSQQWCSYLRRHAFSTTSSEDDIDTAEVGIIQALEDVQQAGQTIYGNDFKGDPLYRLETIQIKFLTEARRLNDARDIYMRLVPQQKDSFEFWSQYYTWELWIWGLERMSETHRVETSENGPHRASAVVQQALSQRNLDWPEKVLAMYLNHFQQHESGEKLQTALIDAREFSKRLAARRAQEAEQAAEVAAQQQSAVVDAQPATTGEKRKAEEPLTNGELKKAKTGDVLASVDNGESSASASAQIKRDREHNTVTVRGLPADVAELDIKKFFRDVGQPLSINILRDAEGDSATATVEFESHEDVVAAKTRNGKELDGHEVRIHSGSQNTLYVANYPPDYDESGIRKLFENYGEIISVRFPSLKYNSRRRFCYVQFVTDEMARAAEAAMDSKMLDGQHKLVAKVSNPDAKKQRSGAQAEGREIFVKNLHREASDDEVKTFFEQYGSVVSMNLVKLVNNKRTGTGFIVFSSADEANAALAANNKPFRDRILHVQISTPKAEGRAAPVDRARKEDVIIKHGVSASPEPDSLNRRRGSDVSMVSASNVPDESYKTARERKIAIFNLPDTVNDARIRTAMEQYGPIIKIQLRRQDNGAIVEFADINVAFNVRQGVDCTALGPEVKTGDVADLLSKVKKRQATNSEGPTSGASGSAMRPPAVSRPGQLGGRRGGLGYKRGVGKAYGGSLNIPQDANPGGVDEPAVEHRRGVGKASGGPLNLPQLTASKSVDETAAATKGVKSNADFRAMLEASKPKPAED